MKRIISVLTFTLFLLIIGISSIYAYPVKQGEGGYFISSGECREYPDLRINISNPDSSNDLSYAYCVELNVGNVNPWSVKEFYACNRYDSFSCVEKEVAYLGTSRGGTDFWAAQTYLNGRKFYKNSGCSELISYAPIEADARAYCTVPTIPTQTITEGEAAVLSFPELADYVIESSSSNLQISRDGNNFTIVASSPGTGEILFSKGSKTSFKGFCRDNYQNSNGHTMGQDLAVAVAEPYVSLTVNFNIIEGVHNGTFKLIKVDSVDTTLTLPGAEYKVCTNEAMTENCHVYTTDANGTFTTGEFPLGATLYYQETLAPTDYILDPTLYNISIAHESINECTRTNKRIQYGSLKLTKVDSVDVALVLPGAEYNVCTNEAMTENCHVYTTDANGTFTTGEYVLGTTLYFQETSAPGNYKIDLTIYNKKITQEGENEKIVMDILKHHYIKIFKQSKESKEPLKNVRINVCKKDGTLYKELLTDSNGEVQVDLGIGEYYFEEPEPPTGYEKVEGKLSLINKSTNIEVNELILDINSTEYMEFIVYNTLINVKTGNFDVFIIFLVVSLSVPLVLIYLAKRQKFI